MTVNRYKGIYSKRYVILDLAFSLIGLLNSQRPSTLKYDHVYHREDDKSCAWPLYNLVQIFPKALHSDSQGGGDYMTGLVQTSSEETGPDSRSL